MTTVLIVEDDEGMSVALRCGFASEGYCVRAKGNAVPIILLTARGQEIGKGVPVELSAREFRLLAIFASRRGEVVTRESLLDAVWETRGAPLTRTVDMHVAKLRKKIEPDPREPRHLLTVHGLGHKLTDG